MKTLADFKRLIKVGQKWHAFNHLLNKDMGIRIINRVQSNAFTFATDKGESWCYFPKASEFKVIDSNTVQIYEDDKLCLTYKLLSEV